MAKSRTTPQRPAPKSVAARQGRPTGLFTWIAVGLVIVVVAALVIIKVAASSSPTTAKPFQATDATTASEVTSVPASIFNTVGVTSPAVGVTPPTATKAQPVLTATSGGKKLPEVFYDGAEYCPYCAAQRWSTIVALSRFGTWSGLGNTSSSPSDFYPSTQTFTFLRAHFHSTYLAFVGVEELGNVIDPVTGNYPPLQTPTALERTLMQKYDNTTYFPGIKPLSIPFISFANQYLIAGATYSPAVLSGLTRSQIASSLATASSPVTQAIVASANLQTAALCTLTKNKPASVCSSPGVKAAKTSMHLK
ncbi:MAG TPA: DUF929 family protein [Acidimicrobiales bacterium]|nr:DUF929 family protein [Acidimicrobiales bacterium]